MAVATRVSDTDDRTRRAVTAAVRGWLEGGRPIWVPIVGESMAPFLPHGSRILATRITAAAVRPGDLILHERAGRMVCHRVLRRRLRHGRVALLTRGDAWVGRGQWLAGGRVIGRVVAVERDGRRVRLDTAFGQAAALVTGTFAWMRGRARAVVGHVRWRWRTA